MNVLITGGAGYVGSHTAFALSESGHQPVVLDNLSRGSKDNVLFGPFYEGNIGNKDLLAEIFEKEKIEAVIHFAAYAFVGESIKNPLLYHHNNVVETISLLKAIEDFGARQLPFIFSSSCAVYGSPKEVEVFESTPLNPISPYGASKLMGEQVLEDASQSSLIRCYGLRYFNACGNNTTPHLGSYNEPEQRIVPLAIKASLDKDFTLSLYGDDFPTKDGSCVRDFIHVNDLANAHVLALKHLCENPKTTYDIFNLGSESATSMLDLFSAVESVTGAPVKHTIAPRRQGDPAQLMANAQKAKNTFQWQPQSSELSHILKTAVNWHISKSK